MVDRTIVDRLMIDRPMVDRPLVDRPLVGRPLVDRLMVVRPIFINFDSLISDGQTDICDSRVAFATENQRSISSMVNRLDG